MERRASCAVAAFENVAVAFDGHGHLDQHKDTHYLRTAFDLQGPPISCVSQVCECTPHPFRLYRECSGLGSQCFCDAGFLGILSIQVELTECTCGAARPSRDFFNALAQNHATTFRSVDAFLERRINLVDAQVAFFVANHDGVLSKKQNGIPKKYMPAT